MQLLARLMDHVLTERGERATIVGATSGDTGGAAIAAFAASERTDIFILFPHGRVSPVQQRQMTTSGAGQRPRARHRRHVRRLPGAGEGACSTTTRFRDRVAALRRQLDQLGPHHGPDRLLLHRRRQPRRAGPRGLLHRADRQFRRHLRRLCRQAHGPADRPAGHRHQRQRHPRPHAGDRPLRDDAASTPRPRPRWTSRSRRTSSACCSRPAAAMPTTVRRADAAARPVRRLHAARGDARRASAPSSTPAATDEAETADDHPRRSATTATCSIRTPPSASRVAERRIGRQRRWSRSPPPIRPNSPTPSRPPAASRRPCRRAMPT